jgi:hypothetical protein
MDTVRSAFPVTLKTVTVGLTGTGTELIVLPLSVNFGNQAVGAVGDWNLAGGYISNHAEERRLRLLFFLCLQRFICLQSGWGFLFRRGVVVHNFPAVRELAQNERE